MKHTHKTTPLRSALLLATTLLGAALFGCGDSEPEEAPTLTYYGEAKSIIDARCATCHRAGEIGPFPLTTYQEVSAYAVPVRASIVNGTMPPWQPADDCNTFVDSIDLTAGEEEILLAWLDQGAPEGTPRAEPEDQDEHEHEHELFEVDLSLQLPEPYTPTLEPDDHRCQLIPWPETETRFVTATRVTPDARAIVHHVILFVVGPEQVAEYEAYDAAEEGPGYTCYGGPTPSNRASEPGVGSGPRIPEQLGSWVPGMRSTPFPAGTGIRVEPGSMLVAQMHYNTSSATPVADQSTIEIAITDTVEKEATFMQVVDFGWVSGGAVGGDAMTIPAGETGVAHDTSIPFDSVIDQRARRTLGLAEDAPLVLYTGSHHMHELGESQRTELQHADGTSSCLLDTPEWDFAWQGRYTFADPMTFGPGDSLWMGCTWDNSPSNQPIIDGAVREPITVEWGEGTSDEMCLSGFYVTGE